MSFVRAGWAVAAVVLLAAGGCDYWDNLVDTKTLTRADLEVTVVDAWTGEALAGASCRDSLQSVSGVADGQGVFHVVGGATGQYALTCGHEWYFDGAANIHLTKAGAHAVAKLARRGLADWYREDYRRVGIPQVDQGVVRFPLDLDWQATPADTNRHFRYEWSFLRASSLNFGQPHDSEELDPKAYLPHFHKRATSELGVTVGPDTAFLKVYSLLDGSRNGYLVGAFAMGFEWVRNLKPYIQFDSLERTRHPRVDCHVTPEWVHFEADDTDGRCDSIRFWTKSWPTIRKMDTLLSCEEGTRHKVKLDLLPPGPGVVGVPNRDGSEDFSNLLFVEITDNNGEKTRDTLTLRTHTNAPPTGSARILNPRGTYLQGDPITFEVFGKDTDGGIERMQLFWFLNPEAASSDAPWTSPNFPFIDTAVNQWTETSIPAGVYSSKGKVIDDCEDSIFVNGPPFTILKNTPPSIAITNRISTARATGDSLDVLFDLAVKDPDKDKGDSLTQVSVHWGTEGIVEKESAPSTPYTKSGYKHAFPQPQAGSTVPIRIHVEDAHQGITDTTIWVP